MPRKTKTTDAPPPVAATTKPKRSRDKAKKPRTTKKQACLRLLRREKGVSLADLQRATGWQAHSVRGFLSGTIRKLDGVELEALTPDRGPRRYRITETTVGS